MSSSEFADQLLIANGALVEALGWTLLHFLWQGTVIAAIVAAALSRLERRDASARYVACGAGLLAMAGAPLITFAVIVSVTSTVPGGSALAAIGSPESAPRLWEQLVPHLPVVTTAWLVGVGILGLRLSLRWLAAQRLRRVGVRPVSVSLRRDVEELCATLGIQRRVAIMESSVAPVPMLIGWMQPMILLPVTALTGLSPEQLRAIIAHELAHVRRHDYIVNLLQVFMETVLFFHPAVWWLSSRLRTEREYCCDDIVVGACADVVCYARALAALEELRSEPVAPALASTGGSLMNRIARLAGVGIRPAHHVGRWAIAAAVAASATVIVSAAPAAKVAPEPTKKVDRADVAPGAVAALADEREQFNRQREIEAVIAELTRDPERLDRHRELETVIAELTREADRSKALERFIVELLVEVDPHDRAVADVEVLLDPVIAELEIAPDELVELELRLAHDDVRLDRELAEVQARLELDPALANGAALLELEAVLADANHQVLPEMVEYLARVHPGHDPEGHRGDDSLEAIHAELMALAEELSELRRAIRAERGGHAPEQLHRELIERRLRDDDEHRREVHEQELLHRRLIEELHGERGANEQLHRHLMESLFGEHGDHPANEQLHRHLMESLFGEHGDHGANEQLHRHLMESLHGEHGGQLLNEELHRHLMESVHGEHGDQLLNEELHRDLLGTLHGEHGDHLVNEELHRKLIGLLHGEHPDEHEGGQLRHELLLKTIQERLHDARRQHPGEYQALHETMLEAAHDAYRQAMEHGDLEDVMHQAREAYQRARDAIDGSGHWFEAQDALRGALGNEEQRRRLHEMIQRSLDQVDRGAWREAAEQARRSAEQGRYQEAVEAARRALEAYQQSPEAKQRLHELLQQGKESRKGEWRLERHLPGDEDGRLHWRHEDDRRSSSRMEAIHDAIRQALESGEASTMAEQLHEMLRKLHPDREIDHDHGHDDDHDHDHDHDHDDDDDHDHDDVEV